MDLRRGMLSPGLTRPRLVACVVGYWGTRHDWQGCCRQYARWTWRDASSGGVTILPHNGLEACWKELGAVSGLLGAAAGKPYWGMFTFTDNASKLCTINAVQYRGDVGGYQPEHTVSSDAFLYLLLYVEFGAFPSSQLYPCEVAIIRSMRRWVSVRIERKVILRGTSCLKFWIF